jgi:hypothetical protein
VEGAKSAMQRLEQYYAIIGKEALALALGETPEGDSVQKGEEDLTR